MSEIRKQMEIRFESFGHIIFRHKWIVLILVLAFTACLGSQIPKITIDTSTESFLHEDDQSITIYNNFRDQFGRDEFILVAIESRNIFTMDFLNKLKDLHKELEEKVPHVEEITSLINARNTRGDEDRLIVDDLMKEWPQTGSDLDTLKERILSNKLYLNQIISRTGDFTAIAIRTETYSSLGKVEGDALDDFDEPDGFNKTDGFDERKNRSEENDSLEESNQEFLTDEENHEAVTAVRDVIERYDGQDFQIYLAGSSVIMDVLKRYLVNDMMTFMRLVLIVIGLCLFFMFQRVTGVFLPFLIVFCALIATIGLMAALGIAMTLPTNILPSFLLAVGVGAAVHILSIFYQNLEKGQDRETAVCKAMGHSGLAILLTSLTTAAGLASFATAEVAPIGHLGIFAAVGVLIALMNTMLLLPSLLAIIPVRMKKNSQQGSRASRIDRMLISFANFSTGHPKSIISVCVVLIAFSFMGITRITFGHDPLIWLPEDQSVRIATETVDHALRGSVTLEIVVDTGRDNGLYDIEIMNKLDLLSRELETKEMGKMFIGKTISLSDMLKEIHQALNENRPEFYAIPQDQKVIPQEFLLFENSGSDDLEVIVDSQFRKTRFTIKGPWGDSIRYVPFLKEIEDRFQKVFGSDAEITTTGILPMMIRTLNAAVYSMFKSYVTAFIVITLMMILLIGSLRLGLLSMIPNLLPVIMTLGIVGWFGLTFDMFTMLIGSIAIGLAVDDTVHFMHNFRRYHYESGDVRDSVQKTLLTAGRAMLVTSIVLSIGFFIFMFASMRNLYLFGMLTGITIITALLADFLVAPALMALTVTDTGKKE